MFGRAISHSLLSRLANAFFQRRRASRHHPRVAWRPGLPRPSRSRSHLRAGACRAHLNAFWVTGGFRPAWMGRGSLPLTFISTARARAGGPGPRHLQGLRCHARLTCARTMCAAVWALVDNAPRRSRPRAAARTRKHAKRPFPPRTRRRRRTHFLRAFWTRLLAGWTRDVTTSYAPIAFNN